MTERFKLRVGLVAMAAVWLLAARAGVAQVSLRTVVDLAQRESTAVRMAQADVNKAVATLDQMHDVYVPNLAIGSGVGYSHGFPVGQPSVGTATMQSLVFSGSQQAYIRAARAGLAAANLSLNEAKEQVALDASTAYVELDTVSRELNTARQQQEMAGRLAEIEQQRAEAGVDTAMDLLEAKLTAANLKLARIHLEGRAAQAAKELSVLTGLPSGSITPDHASIPEIPAIKGETSRRSVPGIQAAATLARSKTQQALGDDLLWRRPNIGFMAIYNYDNFETGDFKDYYPRKALTPNNITVGVQINVPFFDFTLRAKARQTAAEALRAKVESEQAERQNELAVAQLTGSLRELDALAEVATLKQQIAEQQLKAVLATLEVGNGAVAAPGSPTQLTPKAEELARIDERQKAQDALDAGFELAKARLSLMRALGHMQDWLDELHGK